MATTVKAQKPSYSGELTVIRALDTYVLGTSKFQEMEPAKLYVDPAYQRGLNPKAVQRTVNNFNDDLFEPLTVNKRTWTKKIVYSVVDGQHRREVAIVLHIPTVTCRVVEVDKTTESELFVELNRQRLYLSPLDAFKAELNAKNPAALEILNCLESRGLVIGANAARTSTNEVSAVSALKKIYAAGGFVALARVLDTVTLSWHEDEPGRFRGDILMGIHVFYRKNPRADALKLPERLSRVTPQLLLKNGTQRWHSWRGLGQSNKSVVDSIAEEINKLYRKHTRNQEAAA